MKRDRRNKVLAHLKLMRIILIDRIQTRLRSVNVSIVFFCGACCSLGFWKTCLSIDER
jgi:hypothetical protein